MIVWRGASPDGTVEVVGKRYSAAGQPLTGDFRINTYTTGDQKFADVASSATGNFVVVWVSFGQDGPAYQILGQRFSSSGAPLGGAFRVNPSTPAYPSHPSVASDAAGNFVVVWNSDAYFGDAVVSAQRYSTTGAPLGGLFQVNTGAFALHSRPAVASDPNGNFVVAWTSYDDSSYSVAARRFSHTGQPLGGEFRANTYMLNGQSRPAVAADAKGNFVIAWLSDTQGGFGGIFGQRYSATGARVGAEFQVNIPTSGGVNDPAVSRSASGDFVVTWTGRDEDVNGVFARRFNSGGVRVGAEFRVNTYTASDQIESKVALLGNGHIIATWKSVDQDHSFSGVYAQLYACGVGGDVDGNGSANVADVFYLINALFAGGPAPPCSGDVDANGFVNVADVFYLVNYLFAGGPAPL